MNSFPSFLSNPSKASHCVNSITLSLIDNIKHTWFGRLEEVGGRHENVLCLLLCLCANFVQPFSPLPPIFCMIPLLPTLFFAWEKMRQKVASKAEGLQTHNVAIWCVLGRRIYPSSAKKESVAKRKQLLIMFSVHHCNPLFEEVGCGCLVRSVCPLQMKKGKINLMNSQLGLEKVRIQNDYDQDRLVRRMK